jgi:2-polyprenyl-6-methoxyphenol hydroxylase-like FAD-dependent oxidoreductase
MKIVCIGRGPAGLYFGLLMKKLNPTHEITDVERNKPCDTFRWGVVFSGATMVTEAAKIGFTPIAWPKRYHSAKFQMECNFACEKVAAAAGKA